MREVPPGAAGERRRRRAPGRAPAQSAETRGDPRPALVSELGSPLRRGENPGEPGEGVAGARRARGGAELRDRAAQTVQRLLRRRFRLGAFEAEEPCALERDLGLEPEAQELRLENARGESQASFV